MLKRLELTPEAHRLLIGHARERGIMFLSSPFDEQAADFLETLDVPAFKIPSGEIVNLPFLRHVAAKGRPVILSTGMADAAEVETAVDEIAAAGLRDLDAAALSQQLSGRSGRSQSARDHGDARGAWACRSDFPITPKASRWRSPRSRSAPA